MKTNDNLCTPRTVGGVRKRFILADGEQDKMSRGCDWKATLKLKNGKYIDVEGAACSIPNCFCDAILVKGRMPYYRWRTFVRSWWKENPAYPDGLEPQVGDKEYMESYATEYQARKACQDYNATHDPGRLSYKMEYEKR